MLIHCTQKLLMEIPGRLADPTASGESWHANLLHVDRRKCVLFTHDKTLFSVFVPGLKKPEFAHLDEVFGQRVFKALVWGEFSQSQVERMLDDCREIRFTRSSNRSVMGSMNDMRFHIKWRVEDAGGLENIDLAQFHHELNRIPFKAVDYEYPVELLKKYYS
jgi:hypothetical protein